MNDYQSLNHAKWECKYHVVFIPKYRRKALYGSLRKHLGQVFRELARQKECEIGEGHLMVDHVHMLISIPPKHSVSQVLGYIKGKSAIHIARTYGGKRRNFVGSTSGRGVTGYRRWVTTKRPYGSISRSKRRKTNASISWDCSRAKAALSGSQLQASGFAGGR